MLSRKFDDRDTGGAVPAGGSVAGGVTSRVSSGAKTDSDVGGAVGCPVEIWNDCLREDGFDELAPGDRPPISTDAHHRAVVLRGHSLPSRPD